MKDLIKERGYTQEEFAEDVGIGLSTIKKYITGQVSYSIETLDLFADIFNCSYDYLLGKSLTPYREIQDVKQAIRLSDGAPVSYTHLDVSKRQPISSITLSIYFSIFLFLHLSITLSFHFSISPSDRRSGIPIPSK